MDLIALLIGAAIGLVIGFAVAWVWANSLTKAKTSTSNSTETDLKNMLSQQAKAHLEASRGSIKTLESELNQLLSNVKQYEQSLLSTSDDYSKSTFFGEHASMFLRNNDDKAKRKADKQSLDNQPKDFANSGSGVFLGSPALQAAIKEEKSSQ